MKERGGRDKMIVLVAKRQEVCELLGLGLLWLRHLDNELSRPPFVLDINSNCPVTSEVDDGCCSRRPRRARRMRWLGISCGEIRCMERPGGRSMMNGGGQCPRAGLLSCSFRIEILEAIERRE